MIPSRFCTNYARKCGRPSSGHRAGKGQSSSQSPRKVVPKNALTIGQLYSSPMLFQFSSVQFSCSVVSNSLWPHELQHARPPYPSPTPRVHSDSRPSSRWCHPAISSCHPLLLLPPIPPNIRVLSNESTLHMRWPKYWSFSFSISPSNTQDLSPLEWTGWISLQSKELSRVFSNNIVQKYQFFSAQPSSQSNSHIHIWPPEKP